MSWLSFSWGYATILFLLLLAVLAFHFFIGYLFKKLLPKLEKTHFYWDSSLLKALTFPFKILIWVLVFSFVSEALSYHFENETFCSFFRTIRSLSLLIFFFWVLMRFIKNMEIHYVKGQRRKKRAYDKTTLRAVCQISRIVVIVIAFLSLLQMFRINISAVLAFGGAGGIVVAFAAKDLLANFFGGLMIFLDRPFNVGDWIRSPDREIEGHVETIGWRLTRIRTFSKRILYVPNGVFSTISVENPSRMSHRRIKVRIGIRYEDSAKMGEIVTAAEKMLRSEGGIDTDMRILVRFDEFGTSSLNFLIYCFTKAVQLTDYLTVQQSVYLKILEIIERHGAQCAFPTTTLHVPEGIRTLES